MNYMDIKILDIANGPGCRVSLFVSGCRRHCKECFNPETWDFSHGKPFTLDVENKVIEQLKHSWIDGLTILGGEPFEPENQVAVLSFIKKVREELSNTSIWMYTGFKVEELWGQSIITREILNNIDILVDGEFINELKDIRLQYCGSKNQRVINTHHLQFGKIFTYDQYDFSNGEVKKSGLIPFYKE